jgi:16S rRNA (guanine(966)-N(2))-methyltransferase RsmD
MLRVIAGAHKGRRLKTPAWDGLRPTSDRLRETLFNVASSRIAGARVLDGFAGTGALGIEALSRGAVSVAFIDEDPRACALVAENLARCGIENGYAIIRASVARGIETLRAAGQVFDLLLLDPPYDHEPARALNGVEALMAPDALLVLEHGRRQPVPAEAGRLRLGRDLKSGDSALAFYTCPP